MNKYITGSYKYSFTPEGKQFVQSQLEQGLSYAKIAQQLNISSDTLSKLCKENGIARDNRRKYSLNEHYFDKIDSKEKAY